MPTMRVTLEVGSLEDAKVLECLAARLGEIRDATEKAPDGEVVRVCEDATLAAVQEVGCAIVEQSLQARIDRLEKKGDPSPLLRPSHAKQRAAPTSIADDIRRGDVDPALVALPFVQRGRLPGG